MHTVSDVSLFETLCIPCRSDHIPRGVSRLPATGVLMRVPAIGQLRIRRVTGRQALVPRSRCGGSRGIVPGNSSDLVPAPGLEPGRTQLQRLVRCQLRYAGVSTQPVIASTAVANVQFTIPAAPP